MTADAVPEWWFMGPSARERQSSPKEAMTDGRVLEGVVVDPNARVEACKLCGKAIWFGRTANGKPNPFDVLGQERTAVTHFSTCPRVGDWRKGARQ